MPAVIPPGQSLYMRKKVQNVWTLVFRRNFGVNSSATLFHSPSVWPADVNIADRISLATFFFLPSSIFLPAFMSCTNSTKPLYHYCWRSILSAVVVMRSSRVSPLPTIYFSQKTSKKARIIYYRLGVSLLKTTCTTCSVCCAVYS